MKVQAVGVYRMIGVKDGRAYDFANLLVLNPVEPVKKDTFERICAGYEVAELKVALDSVSRFVGLKYPVALTLETEANVSRGGKLELLVTGFEPVSKAAAA